MKFKVDEEKFEAAWKKASDYDPAIRKAALAGVPPSWRMIETSPLGAAFRRGNINVIFSVAKYGNELWLHASCCGVRGLNQFFLPEWEDVKRMKHDFLGDRWAYQVFPPDAEYINQNPYVLHLFALWERGATPPLPDFTLGLGTL